MKRRSKTSPRDLPSPRLRSSSVRGFNGVRANPQFIANAVRNKRVKFTVHDADSHPHDEPTASSERHESARPRRSDVPKTSEYAFFKKLKKDARCSKSFVVREEDEQLKISEPSGSIRDFTTVLRDNFDKIRPSIRLGKARLNSNIFSSPPQANVPKNLEAARVVENSHNDIRTPILAKRVNFTDQNLPLSPPGDASQKSGPEELDGDMFSQKRMRLRQWVAETSVPEVEKLCSKGYDLVSALLSRLLPDGDRSKHCRDIEVTPMSTDNEYSTDEFLHKDTYRENFRSRTRDFTEAEPLSYLGDFCNKPRQIVPFKLDSGPFSSPSTSQHLSDMFLLEETYNRKSYWTKSRDRIEADCVWDLGDDFSKSRKMIPLYLDTRITTSPSASHAHFQYGNNKQYFNFDDGTTSIFSSHEPYFRSDLEAYGSNPLSHIKEQNKFKALDESDYGRGSETMLLGWNFANSQDKRDSSHATCDKEMNLHSTLIAPWCDQHLSMHNSFGVHEPHSILLDTDVCSDTTLFPFTHLEKLNWDSRFFEEDKLVAKLEPYPVPLSYVPKCLDIREDHDTYTSCNVNDGISLQHNNWVINKILSEQHHSELEPPLPFGHGFNTYRKCLSSSGLESPLKERTYCYLLTDEQENFFYSSQNRQNRNPSAEDTINILEWPSLDLQKPSGIEMIRPFLLKNSSSWLPSEEGNHNDGD